MIVPKRDGDEPLDLAKLAGLHDLPSAYKDADRLGGILSASERLQREHDRVTGITQVAIKAAEDARKLYDVSGMAAIREYEQVMNSPAMEAMRRAEELNELIKGPAGIASMVAEISARPNTGMCGPVDYANMWTPEIPEMHVPPPNPVHQTNNLLKEHKEVQSKIATSLEKLVENAEGTAEQNTRMITLSYRAAIIAVIGVVVTAITGGISCYYAGKSSATSPSPAPVAAPVSHPVVGSVAVPVPSKK
jgi:hypothetical protein